MPERLRSMAMALTIHSPEAAELAHRLAAATGESVLDAVTNALRERLARHGKADARTREQRRAAMLELERAFAGHEIYDPRSDNEILGYNKDGFFD